MSKLSLKIGQVVLFSPDLKVDFMKWRWLWLSISISLVVLSIFVITFKGLNYSIDFLGGSEITLSINDKSVTKEAVLSSAMKADVGNIEISSIGTAGGIKESNSYILRFQKRADDDQSKTSAKIEEIVRNLNKDLGTDKVQIGAVTSISGKIGKEEQVKGYLSVLLSLVGILIYVAFRFESQFSPGAVVCLFHDVIIAVGFMTALGRPFSVGSIAAFLTIIGYSINDTIIVYDRIREIRNLNPRVPMIDVINLSINQTMSRTVLTNLTAITSLLILVFFGGGAIEDFALTMLIGFIVGTYSSIYVAAPMTIMLDNWFIKMGWRKDKSAQVAKPEKDPNYIPPVIIRKRTY